MAYTKCRFWPPKVQIAATDTPAILLPHHRGYAAGAMLQELCCTGYAARAMPQGLRCWGYAARAMLQWLCCRGYAAGAIPLANHETPGS